MRITTLLLCFFSPMALVHAEDESPHPLRFNRDIRPILSDKCFKCHGPDSATREADLRLDREQDAKADRGGYQAIVPGDPDASELITRVLSDDPDTAMPPPDSHLSLTEVEKEHLRRWVAAGATWQMHWAFLPATGPQLPAVRKEAWCRNPIDRFVLARIEAAGLKPSPEASRETLLRRVTLDLTGLPPTLAEVDAFVRDDSQQAYENLVDRLLRSARYGERMAWQWLEAARYADTDGYQNDGPRDMWRWRDWVIDAYNRNLPFDHFTIEQLAGDLLPQPTLDQRIATGFNRNHRYNSEAGLVLEEFLLENAIDRVDTTSTVWMGLTMGCARCHDHKYDPFSQTEYYQLISFFDNVPESGRAIKFGNSEPWIRTPTVEQQAKLAQLDATVEQAQRELAAAEDTIAAAQAGWNPATDAAPVVLTDGLTHHFAVDQSVVTDGSKGVTFERIDNLICSGRFSIAFRMTPDQVDRGAILSNETGDTTRKGVLVEFRDGRLRFHIISRWIAGVATLETEESFSPGQSVHVALTNDGTQRAQGMRIYVNGQRAEARTLHNTNSNRSGSKFGGMMQAGASKHAGNWSGRIEDLRFYGTRTLDDSQIAVLAVTESEAEIAAMAPDQRTEIQKAKLRVCFLEQAAPKPLAHLATQLRDAQAARLAYEDTLPTTMVMQEMDPPRETFARVRGVYHQYGERVVPGVPAAFPPLPATYPNNRLGFAQWLVSGNHPLTARVAVNRYWQLLFGRGLVKTPEDFGTQGDLPTHPHLLDWLAVEFVDCDWDVRAMLKQIVMSSTYRQSSRLTPELLTVDPENVWLARAERRRLPGNVLRDQALLLSGLLVERTGGPSVKPYQPAGLWREASNFSYKADKGDALYRRSLYTYWKRTLAPPSMAVLDTADREWCSVKPKHTNTPLQALTLLNETAFFESARKLGERILSEGGTTLDEQITFAFRTVTARQPTIDERRLLRDAYHAYAREYADDSAAIERLLSVGSSPAAATNRGSLAAATALANVLLNLDEVTTRE